MGQQSHLEGNKLDFIFWGIWGKRCMFIGKVAGDQGNGTEMRPGHGIWGGRLPLVIPGDRWSLSLSRRLLRSRDPCLTGWGGWPSNMLMMSMRSMLFRAVYKLSTAVKKRSHRHAWKKEEEGWVSRNHKSVALSEVKWQMSTANLDLLTLCPLALESGPQVEQCGALLQQWVWILHTNLVNVIHTQLKLTCQLCLESDRRKIKKAGEIFI